MARNLQTVQGYVRGTRGLLLDKRAPYRYTDDALLTALNLTLLETRRIRPDLFVCRYGNEVPEFETVSGETVPIEAQFRLGIEYGMAAHVLLRDEEDVQDERANGFLEKFKFIMVGERPVGKMPANAGTPQPKQKQE